MIWLRREGSNLRPPAGGYEPDYFRSLITFPNQFGEQINFNLHQKNKGSIAEPLIWLRREGSNLRPPAGGYEPDYFKSLITFQINSRPRLDFNSFSLAIASFFVANSSL